MIHRGQRVGGNWTVLLLIQGAIATFLFYVNHSYLPNLLELLFLSSLAWGLCNPEEARLKPGERLWFATLLLGWSILALLYKLYCIVTGEGPEGAHAAHIIHFILEFVILETAWKGYQLARAEHRAARIKASSPPVADRIQDPAVDGSRQPAPAEIDFSSKLDFGFKPPSLMYEPDFSSESDRSKKLAKELIARYGVNSETKK